MNPSFSIIVTTYNRRDDCIVAIQSILNQSYLLEYPDRCQVIVVDDCSDVSYFDELYHTFGEKIAYIRHSKNLGLASARNSGIDIAVNEWFAFCDDDDSWHPEILANVAQSINDTSNSADIILGIPSNAYHYLMTVFPSPLTLKDLFFIGMTPPVASQFYKLCHVKDVNSYNPSILSGVDHDLWIRLSRMTLFVSFCCGSPPIIGKNNVVRITNQSSRTYKVINSLSVWKPTLIANFGSLFYLHFEKSYLAHLVFKRFIYLIRLSPLKSFLFFIRHPFLLTIKLLRYFYYPHKRIFPFNPFRSFSY